MTGVSEVRRESIRRALSRSAPERDELGVERIDQRRGACTALHVGASLRNADSAIGQVLVIAAIGEILGPLTVGAIAQAAGLRTGLEFAPLFLVLAGVGLARYRIDNS